MKEQWKKLDSDAKLLVNLEEGRPLPIKIELPISAFVSSKDHCCQRLLTVLRIFVLITALIYLSWATLQLFVYSTDTNVEFDKNTVDNEFNFVEDNDDNKIYRSTKERSGFRPISNREVDIVYVPPPVEDTFVGKESLFAEEPTFVSKPIDENDRLIESMKALDDVSKRWQELFGKMQDEPVKGIASPAPQEPDSLEKTVDEFIRVFMPANESTEKPDEQALADPQQQEKTDDEAVKMLFQIINSLAFKEQMSVEDVDFTRPASSKTEDVEKEKIGDLKDVQVLPSLMDRMNLLEPTVVPDDKELRYPLEFATLLARYLEPAVGENDEMLVWYYRNRNKPNFESDNDQLKVYTAKLLYSTDIAAYPADLQMVLNSLMNDENFARDLKMLQDGVYSEKYRPELYRIIDRMHTKFNMNKLIKEDPKVVEVFSRMIETNNRLELSRANVDPEELLFGEIAVKPSGVYIESPEEMERQRLSVLEAIRKVANDDVVPPVDELVTEDDDDNTKEEDTERMRNVINAMKKVAIDDETKDHGLVEFVEETTPDAVAIEQENESLVEPVGTESEDYEVKEKDEEKEIEKMEEMEKQLETLIETIRKESSDIGNSEEQEEEDESADMNNFLQIYSDFYDY